MKSFFNMDRKKLINNITGTGYVLMAALLWGSSFAVRKIGMKTIGPLMMNACRFSFAFFLMLLVILIRMYFFKECRLSIDALKKQIKTGILIGLTYGLNVVFQQIGLTTVSAGETGFVTSLYSVMVPIISWLVFKKKVKIINWIAVIMSAVGLYLVTEGGINLNFGMVMLFIGTVFAAIQILIIGRHIHNNDPFILVAVQTFVGIVINLLIALMMREPFELNMIKASLWPIIYSGIFSIGVANLLQFIGQRKISPTVTAIACSMESVFGLMFGILLLGEMMTLMKACGCIIILITIIMVQYESKSHA